MKTLRSNRGQLSLQVLIFGFVAIIMLSGFVLWADSGLRAGKREELRAKAFAIAEAGIEYYRWHLAHDPDDFEDGTGAPGPYIHDFFDKDGNKIGEFELDITPPIVGSTIATIRSTGRVEGETSVERIIEARLGIPSFAQFSAVANADIRFGAGTEVFGLLHSNGGIRFDGLAHNLVTSALTSYDDPDHTGGNEWAVHTHVSPTDPTYPTAWNNRTDIFSAGRLVGVPQVDFAGITQDLADIRSLASTSGFYRGPSGAQGYEVVLKTDDTFDFYRVNSLVAPPTSGCTNYLSQSGWGTWSIQNRTLLGNYAFPGNGLIFLEDNAWVRGQINTARLTIAAGRFPVNPATYASITFTNDILYTNYDGRDVISLITQNNINAGMASEDNLRVDAALIAQNGRVGRYYYRSPGGGSNRCSPYHTRQVITLYGMIGTNQRYGFAYTDGTGYVTRNITYDGNLLYGPPPSFPLTASTYETLTWEEVK